MRSRCYVALIMAALLLAQPLSAHVGLDAPNGGETFIAGGDIAISWHVHIEHTLESWDLWYALDAPDPLAPCADQSGPTWIPIEMGIPATCTHGSGSCEDPTGGCIMEYVWTTPDGIESDQLKVRVRMNNVGNDYYDVSNDPFTITSETGVASPPQLALRFVGSHPNPFNPKTTINYAIAAAGRVKVRVYDITGAEIVTLLDEVQAAGSHGIVWDGKDDAGHPVTAGVFLVQIESAGIVARGKLTLLK